MEATETKELRRGALRAKAVLVAMAIVAASAALISMRVLYSAGVSEQRARLMEIASSQAELIDAVARFDAVQSQDANPAGAWVATLGQVAGGFASWHREDADVSLSVIPASFCACDAKTESAVVSVEDRGTGMNEDVLAKAFEPLFSTKGFGVGLGLPIVRELAERNGGGIELSSRPGEGTRAVLRFPLGSGVS